MNFDYNNITMEELEDLFGDSDVKLPYLEVMSGLFDVCDLMTDTIELVNLIRKESTLKSTTAPISMSGMCWKRRLRPQCSAYLNCTRMLLCGWQRASPRSALVRTARTTTAASVPLSEKRTITAAPLRRKQ